MLTIFTAPAVKRRMIAAADARKPAVSLSTEIVVTLLRHYRPKGSAELEAETLRQSLRTNSRPTITETSVTSKDGCVPSQAKIPEELHEKIVEAARRNWRTVAREIARVLTETYDNHDGHHRD